VSSLDGSDAVLRLLAGRLEDLLAGLGRPGANERLQFGRLVLGRRDIDPATASGQERAAAFLDEEKTRAFRESARHQQEIAAARARRDVDAGQREEMLAAIFRDRGLSSDTSIAADFGLDLAIRRLRSDREFPSGGVTRLAIVGPGLDFTDKLEGFDFYPQQTIQPFAVMDSLIRSDLSTAANLRVVTFDVSARVNAHLDAARARAAKGEPYVLQLPLQTNPNGAPGGRSSSITGARSAAASAATCRPCRCHRVQPTRVCEPSKSPRPSSPPSRPFAWTSSPKGFRRRRRSVASM
jgi:hypothetical protein